MDAQNVAVAWLAIRPNLPSLGLLPLFNRPPVVATPHAQDGEVGDDVSLQVQAADPDGDAIEFSASGLPPGLAIDPDTGEITGTLASPATHVVTVRATDSSNAFGEAEFVWTVRARLEALPFPAPPTLVGGTVSYTAQTNLPGNFVYQWDFGDGSVSAPSSSPEVSHTYAAPGRYVVTLTVTDPVHGSQDQLQFVQNVTAAATALRPTTSSSILYEAASNRVWVVDPDNDAVRVIDALTQTGLAVIPVCADPRTLAVAGNGQIWVACKDAAAVDRIDPLSLAVVGTVPLPWGSQPHGLVFDPTGASAFVALEASGRILKLDGASGAVLASAEVGRHVRHLAVTADGAWLHATRFVTPLLPNESQGAPQVALGGVALGGELLRLHTATLALDRVTVLEASTGAGQRAVGARDPELPRGAGDLAAGRRAARAVEAGQRAARPRCATASPSGTTRPCARSPRASTPRPAPRSASRGSTTTTRASRAPPRGRRAGPMPSRRWRATGPSP